MVILNLLHQTVPVQEQTFVVSKWVHREVRSPELHPLQPAPCFHHHPAAKSLCQLEYQVWRRYLVVGRSRR